MQHNIIQSLGQVVLLGAVACVLGGCTQEDAAPDDDAAANLHPLFACIDQEFDVSKPLVGERYDPAEGGLIDPTQTSYFVHTTQIFVRAEEQQLFGDLVGPILLQLADTPGLLAYSLSSDPACGDYRTLGIWESEEAIFNFMVSGAHAQAMPETSRLSEAARTFRWEATVEEVNALTWTVAKDKIADIAASDAY